MKIQLTEDSSVWYRSAVVWFMSLAGLLELVQTALPRVHDLIPEPWYNAAMVVCVIVGTLAKFIRQPRMERALEYKKAEKRVKP